MADSPEDPFERVRREAAKGDGGKAAKADAGDLVSPVPADAPPPLQSHKTYGQVAFTWAYRDAAGAVLAYVCRFNKPDGSKSGVLPQVLRRSGGKLAWRWGGMPEPRPIYGLDRLAARPAAPVLIAEGEKDADGAGERFPGLVCITWPGGSNAVGKADFSALSGRDVIIWGDADGPGHKAAQAVAKAATAAGALTVAVVPVPGYFPEGWGLADAWPEGFDQDKAAALIDAARAGAQPGGVEWPWGFRMDEQGLWYDQPSKDGAKPIPTRISAPFEIVGEGRDPEGGGWALVLRFRDRDGLEKTYICEKARLSSGGAEVRGELAARGLTISPARGKSDKFAIALTEATATRRRLLVSATGWCGERFVLPDKVIGAAVGEEVMFTGDKKDLFYRSAGSLEGWQSGVAAMAEGNDLLAFGLSVAFVGPLLRPLGWEGGGIHLRGGSSCGKTTILAAAGSAWGGGGPKGFVHDWRVTDSALEGLAVGHNDGVLMLDELKNIDAAKAGIAAYMLASGQAKARARSDGSGNRPRAEWRVFVISSGELSLADHVASDRKGERTFAGQEIRLLDIAADMGGKNVDGSPKGVWQDLRGHGSSFEASKALEEALGHDYGHAVPAFLEHFAARRVESCAHAKALLSAFLKDVAREGDTGQAQRGAERFGAVAVAGELAVLFGVLPWPSGMAYEAAKRLYHRWAASFGRDRSREAGEVLKLVRKAIETTGGWAGLGDDEATEPTIARDGEARSLDPYGWRRVRGPEITYLFTRGGWARALTGHNPSEAARALADAGYLDRDVDGQRLQKKVSVRGEKHWLYCVRGEILEADDLGD
jgi:putative DNA primase/helicase